MPDARCFRVMRANLGRLSTFGSFWEAWRDPIRVLIGVLQLQARLALTPLSRRVRIGPDTGSVRASAATGGDPIAEVPLAQVATRDGADDAVGLIRIIGR